MAEQVSTKNGAPRRFIDQQQAALIPNSHTVNGVDADRVTASSVALTDEPNWRGPVIIAVIPAYNEDRFIGSVVLKAKPYVDRVIVIDDGSSDHTAAVARRAGAQVVVHAVNQGKANALETGFDKACELNADIVVTLDGDGQHDPTDIPEVIRPILQGEADMVIGSRFYDNRNRIPTWRRLGQHTLTLVTNAASGTTCSDSQSGFRAFTREAVEAFDLGCEGFAAESAMQFWASQGSLCLVEVPVGCVYIEKAKRNPFHHGLQVMSGVVRLTSQSRPRGFFGLLGLPAVMIGTGWWWWLVRSCHQTGELALGPSLMATLLVILGVLSTFLGVTMHAVQQIIHRALSQAERPTNRADSQKKSS